MSGHITPETSDTPDSNDAMIEKRAPGTKAQPDHNCVKHYIAYSLTLLLMFDQFRQKSPSSCPHQAFNAFEDANWIE